MIALSFVHCTSAPNDFVGWAQHEAQPLDDPVEFLGASVGDARLVGLGESRHDTREQTLVKAQLVRHLVEELGFRTLLLEESVFHVRALDTVVTSGEGDLRGAMSRLAGWYLWDTEEMLEMMEWIRDYNRNREDPVRIVGIDITAPAAGTREVLRRLEQAGINTTLDEAALGLELHRGDFWPKSWQNYGSLLPRRRKELAENFETLHRLLKAERLRLTLAHSEAVYERMVWDAKVAQTGHQFFCSADRASGGVIRERGMATASLRALDLHDGRAILWAHNLHVAHAPFSMPDQIEGLAVPMGVRLKEELGDAYVAIGASFGEGSYSGQYPPGNREFPVRSADSVDGSLSLVAEGSFLLDLRNASEKAAAWLGEDRSWRQQDAEAWLVPSAAFEMVYHVPGISRAEPTPLALRKYRAEGQ